MRAESCILLRFFCYRLIALITGACVLDLEPTSFLLFCMFAMGSYTNILGHVICLSMLSIMNCGSTAWLNAQTDCVANFSLSLFAKTGWNSAKLIGPVPDETLMSTIVDGAIVS
jgi:hypothetical protein